jgi:hypothetical protein
MKTKIFCVILIVILTSCAVTPPRADNFSFVYQAISCGFTPFYILDSAHKTLTHTPVGDTESIIISFLLTDEELETIYQKAISIDFFDYPVEFVVPDSELIGYEVPQSHYELYIVNGEMEHTVRWTGGALTKPGYLKAENLQEFIRLINDIIQSHPEIKQLPAEKAGCA